jgi:hypothetical protein
MNLVKAADDIKNLSDQQLLAAGQNPVVVPPYLVLAEMKRREQLRAQYAKAQQQQQQPSVAQQVAQNLVQPQMQQGQPQQGAPQQPPPQGIMQAAPPQAMAMAQGGHVARYAEGDLITDRAEYMKQFRQGERTPQEFGAIAEQMLGKPDYSRYEDLIRRQRQLAESKKPSFGDALIAAGTAIASNRDPRVGLASLLAQGIGVGSQSYKAAKEQREKDINAAMMAEMSLERMRQQDQEKKAATMMNLMQMDSGQLQTIANNLGANARAMHEASQRSKDRNLQMQYETKARESQQAFEMLKQAAQIKANKEQGNAEMANRLRVAEISAGSRGIGRIDPKMATAMKAAEAEGKLIQNQINSLNDNLKIAPRKQKEAIQKELMELYRRLRNIQERIPVAAGIEVVD